MSNLQRAKNMFLSNFQFPGYEKTRQSNLINEVFRFIKLLFSVFVVYREM